MLRKMLLVIVLTESDDIAMSTSTQTNHNNSISLSQPLAAANSMNTIPSPSFVTSPMPVMPIIGAICATASRRSYKDIAGDNALKLRRMEREQIMCGVLEWLFPGFDDASSIFTTCRTPVRSILGLGSTSWCTTSISSSSRPLLIGTTCWWSSIPIFGTRPGMST